jgi:type VI secretion system protein ImpE
MLDISQYIVSGDLEAALKTVQQQVRQNPAESKWRILLFQLYAVLGNWDKARTQLAVLQDLDAYNLALVRTYEQVLLCEMMRQAVFAGQKTPLVFGEPQQWIALLQEALKLTAQKQYSEAKTLRDQAFDLAPATPGKLNGEVFDWIADADMRLGPMLEAIINGQYYWIPFQHIKTIQLEEPTDLRDVVWMPAFFTWRNQGETVGFIPTRYPNSETQPDSLLKLARKTQWLEPSPDLFIGLGQRLLSSNTNEYALMDVREISFTDVNS